MATNLYNSNIYGLNSGGRPALRFSDELSGGDLAWIIGADDRGGSASGDNSLVLKTIGGTSRGNAFTDANWYTTGTEVVTFGQNGSIGIGVSNPAYKLHVAGTLYSSGSSIEYKENIETYDKTVLQKVLKLRPVKYQYKEQYIEFGKKLQSDYQIGLIAEEVLEIFPELCVMLEENGKDVVRNIDYEKLSVILIKCLNELENEIIKLESINN